MALRSPVFQSHDHPEMAQRSPIFWLHNHGESANNFPEGMPHCQQLLHLFLKIAVGVLPESRNGSPSRSNVDILARTSRPATVLSGKSLTRRSRPQEAERKAGNRQA